MKTSVIKQASQFALALYEYATSPTVQWIDRVENPVCWAVGQSDGIDFLVFRGSVTLTDWHRDFEAIAEWNNNLQAHVHPGFAQDIDAVMNDALELIGDNPFVICGHSLGAARAAIATTIAIRAKKLPLARITWGEPRPGFLDLARQLAAVPNYNFVNGGREGYDRVCDVPFTLPGEWYCAGAPQLFVNEPPGSGLLDRWGFFSYHHFDLYDRAMQRLADGDM